MKKSNLPYMVIGGQAVLIYGEPRMTKDIDITLGVGIEELSKVKKITQTLGLENLAENVDDFVKKTMVYPVLEETSGIRVDFIFSHSIYEHQAIERAVERTLDEIKIKYASLEDVVVHKIIAGRARDIEDLKCILLKNPEYDRDYIEKWLKAFDESLNENYLINFNHLIKKIN